VICYKNITDTSFQNSIVAVLGSIGAIFDKGKPFQAQKQVSFLNPIALLFCD